MQPGRWRKAELAKYTKSKSFMKALKQKDYLDTKNDKN